MSSAIERCALRRYSSGGQPKCRTKLRQICSDFRSLPVLRSPPLVIHCSAAILLLGANRNNAPAMMELDCPFPYKTCTMGSARALIPNPRGKSVVRKYRTTQNEVLGREKLQHRCGRCRTTIPADTILNILEWISDEEAEQYKKEEGL